MFHGNKATSTAMCSIHVRATVLLADARNARKPALPEKKKANGYNALHKRRWSCSFIFVSCPACKHVISFHSPLNSDGTSLNTFLEASHTYSA